MNMDQSESNEPQNNSTADTEWDDALLNSAFDRALKMDGVEVARRLAMATNTKPGEPHPLTDKAGSSSKQSKKKQWTTGKPCRAIHKKDGVEYEAFVLSILNHTSCIVKFVGYDNTEHVDISTLKPSQGKEAQQHQRKQAIDDRAEKRAASTSSTDDVHSDRRQSSTNTDRTYKKKNPKKKTKLSHNIDPPEEEPVPDWNNVRNNTSKDVPFPKPPSLHLASSSDDDEDDALSRMLIAWYMSGYYTGLYQGRK